MSQTGGEQPLPIDDLESSGHEATMPDTDEGLVERCLDGHPDDYRHLITRYQRPLLAFLGGRLRQRTLVEDAAQEAFVRAFFNLRRLRKRDAFFSWLVGIAHRVARELVRHEQAERRHAAEQLAEPRASVVASSGDKAHEALRRAVSELSDPLRDVILLRYFADCSCLEIAHRLGLPVGTVTKRLSRAYAEIRDRLAPDGLQE